MFRDPRFFRTFRERAVPLLRTYPFIRIWQAGCSTGEEVYSLAILLREEGLYDRCRIYATDMNDVVLKKAREGIYPLDVMQEYTANYIAAGGTRRSPTTTPPSTTRDLRASLREHVVFSQHNLVSDGVFNEFNVILCRNVMIYFTRPLQERVLDLFSRSLQVRPPRPRLARVAALPREGHEYEPLRRVRSCSGGRTDGVRARRRRRVHRRPGGRRHGSSRRCRTSLRCRSPSPSTVGVSGRRRPAGHVAARHRVERV